MPTADCRVNRIQVQMKSTLVSTLVGLDVGHYRLGRRLGSGKFGTVYSGIHRLTGDAVAIKVEPEDSRTPRLPTEASVYKALGAQYVPRMRWFGRAHGQYALVMDRLGPSLRSVQREAGMRLDLVAVQRVGEAILECLETLHGTGWLHLDVKPANILGPDPSAARAVAGCASSQWTLVDFGLARRWCDQQTGEHTPDVRRRGVVGTGRYASLANHSGEPLGRRDDLESLALTLAFLHEGRLPWSAHDSALPAPTKPERFALMLAEKQRACVDEIAGTLPSHFREYLRAVRLLRYDERPNYGVLRALLSLGG